MARVNPPLRTAKDIKGIITGLKDGTIDAIATDHAPHSAEEKARPLAKAPSGMIGLETSLAISLTELYHTGRMKLPDLIRRMTYSPAAILPPAHQGAAEPGQRRGHHHLRPGGGVDHRPGAVRLQGPEHPLRRPEGEGPREIHHCGRGISSIRTEFR